MRALCNKIGNGFPSYLLLFIMFHMQLGKKLNPRYKKEKFSVTATATLSLTMPRLNSMRKKVPTFKEENHLRQKSHEFARTQVQFESHCVDILSKSQSVLSPHITRFIQTLPLF